MTLFTPAVSEWLQCAILCCELEWNGIREYPVVYRSGSARFDGKCKWNV